MVESASHMLQSQFYIALIHITLGMDMKLRDIDMITGILCHISY